MCYLRVPLSFALVLCKSHTVTVSGLGNWLASLKHITPQAGAVRSRREWQREKWCRDSSTTDQAAFGGRISPRFGRRHCRIRIAGNWVAPLGIRVRGIGPVIRWIWFPLEDSAS